MNSVSSESIGHRGAVGLLVVHHAVVPAVASFRDVDEVRLAGELLHDHHVLHGRAVLQGAVGVVLQRHHGAAPPPAVGGDQHRAARVVDPVRKRIRGEAAEHDVVDGADAGTCQHRHGRLQEKGHVDGHPVALADAELLQAVGELADLAVKLQVGQGADVAVLPFPDDGRLVAPRARRGGGRWRCR